MRRTRQRAAEIGLHHIADEYFGLDEASNFRDLELLLGGDVVQTISGAFDEYWNNRWSFPIETISHERAAIEQLADAGRASGKSAGVYATESADRRQLQWLKVVETADTGEAVLFVDRPPEDNPKNRDEAPIQVANELVDLFENATSEVLIVSAYLIPTPRLEGAVERAIDRGVRVHILTNSIGSNNHLSAHGAYRRHIDTLLEHGAELHEVRIDAADRDRYLFAPTGQETLALHAKALVVDDDKVFIGSANLDPRSLRINTEMGFLIVSNASNRTVRAAFEDDFSGANAWRLELQESGKVYWISDEKTLESQPALSGTQRIEDWFFCSLPIEGKL